MERAAELGEPAGVLQLFVAHPRDGKAIADRLGVPFHVLPDVLPDSPFSVLDLDLGPWKERALWWPELKGLVVAESLGTATHYAVGRGLDLDDVLVRRYEESRRRHPLSDSERVSDGIARERNDYRAALNVSSEVDLWGRLRTTAQAARSDLLASEAARETVRITLVADVPATGVEHGPRRPQNLGPVNTFGISN
ncbi:hypothetical protein B4Q13_17070 [Lacticaseibacillus rhamnosus]